MELKDREALERFVRANHVHYDVEREQATPAKDENEVVGFDIRLLASHEGSLQEPGCPKCSELLARLQEFAEKLVAAGDAASWTEIVPEPDMLYQSSEFRDADEVALTLRIHRDEHEHRAEGAEQDGRFSEIRARLEAVGATRHS